MSIKSALLGAIAAIALTASAAQADILTFTYNHRGASVGGVFDGTLQPDHNTFVVTGYQSFSINGAPFAFTPSNFFGSADAFSHVGMGYSGNGSATLTLDGSYLDLTAFDGTNGLTFLVNNLMSSKLGNLVYNAGAFEIVGSDDPFVPGGWSASVSAVPEPATLAVFGFALLGFGALRRRKAAKA